MTVKTLATLPPLFEMATTEELPLGFDTSVLLAEGQSASEPSAVLVDIATGDTVELEDDPTLSENVITQIVRGSALAAEQRYALSMTFTAAANVTWTMVLTITVPQ